MRVLSYNETARRANESRRSLERQIAQGEGPAVVHISARRRGVLNPISKNGCYLAVAPLPARRQES